MGPLGYGDEFDAGDAPAPVGTWWVPAEIILVGGRLSWPPGGALLPRREAGPMLGLLTSFAALRNGDPDAILAFAQKWGVLDLCGHGLPATHAPERPILNAFAAARDVEDCSPTVRLGGRPWLVPASEGLDRWAHFAAEAQAMMEVFASLHRGGPAAAATWRPLEPLLGAPIENMLGTGASAQPEPAGRLPWQLLEDGIDPIEVPSDAEKVKRQRELLTSAVQSWLDMGDVRVLFVTRKNGFTLEFGSTSLFGALALQLALHVAGSAGLAICTKGGHVYVPERKPRAGENTYCPDCRKAGASRRDGARRAKARKREQAAREADRSS